MITVDVIIIDPVAATFCLIPIVNPHLPVWLQRLRLGNRRRDAKANSDRPRRLPCATRQIVIEPLPHYATLRI
jgi:hypothetical protein